MYCASFESWLNFNLKAVKQIAQALKFYRNSKKKAIVFDWFHVGRLRANVENCIKKHDITGIRVYDIREEKMPDLGMVSMLDAETSCRIDQYQCESSANELWKQYHDKVNYFKETFSKSGSGVVNTRVDESYVTKLLSYFKSRWWFQIFD
jgi:hypothetical protein